MLHKKSADGYGDFPTEEPPYDVIWVTRENQLPASGFPFGNVVVYSNDGI